jgi:hypothetical protein
MLSQSDIQGRLRLFRYGLVVVVIVAFVISLTAPAVALNSIASAGVPTPPVTDFLGTAIMFTIIVAILAAVIYCGYYYILTKSWPWARSGNSEGGAAA